jgi:hypothetical protein
MLGDKSGFYSDSATIAQAPYDVFQGNRSYCPNKCRVASICWCNIRNHGLAL